MLAKFFNTNLEPSGHLYFENKFKKHEERIEELKKMGISRFQFIWENQKFYSVWNLIESDVSFSRI